MSDTSNLPATTDETISARAMAARVNPMDSFLAQLAQAGVVVARQVTRTVLQQVEGMPIAVQFEGAAYQGEELQASKGTGVKMAPARLANVKNIITGDHQSLIMNAVLEGELLRAYGGKADGVDADAPGYVGKMVGINSYFPQDGVDANGNPKYRRYRVYQILELGEKADDSLQATAVVADGEDPVNRKGKAPKA